MLSVYAVYAVDPSPIRQDGAKLHYYVWSSSLRTGLRRGKNTGHAFTMVHRRRPTLGRACGGVPRASHRRLLRARFLRAGFGSGGAVKFPGIGEGRDMKSAEKRAYGISPAEYDSLARPAVRVRLLAALISTFVLFHRSLSLARSLGSRQQHVSPGRKRWRFR